MDKLCLLEINRNVLLTTNLVLRRILKVKTQTLISFQKCRHIYMLKKRESFILVSRRLDHLPPPQLPPTGPVKWVKLYICMPNYMQQSRKLSSIVKTSHNICQRLLKTGFFYVTKGTCMAEVQHSKLRLFLRSDNQTFTNLNRLNSHYLFS